MLIMLAESRSLRRKLVRHPADAGRKDFAELSAFARAKLKRTQRRKTLVAAFWKQAELPF